MHWIYPEAIRRKILICFHASCGKSSFVTTDIILFGECATKDAISLQLGWVYFNSLSLADNIWCLVLKIMIVLISFAEVWSHYELQLRFLCLIKRVQICRQLIFNIKRNYQRYDSYKRVVNVFILNYELLLTVFET